MEIVAIPCYVLLYNNSIYYNVGSTDSGTRIIIGSIAGAIALLSSSVNLALVIVCCLISTTKGKGKGN